MRTYRFTIPYPWLGEWGWHFSRLTLQDRQVVVSVFTYQFPVSVVMICWSFCMSKLCLTLVCCLWVSSTVHWVVTLTSVSWNIYLGHLIMLSTLVSWVTVDHSKSNYLPATELLDIVMSVGLTQVIDSPTSISASSTSLLDHVYISVVSLVCNHSVVSH